MKQLTHVTLGAHYKVRSKLHIWNEPLFLVKYKTLFSSKEIDNILNLQSNNDERREKHRMDLWSDSKSWLKNTQFYLVFALPLFHTSTKLSWCRFTFERQLVLISYNYTYNTI